MSREARSNNQGYLHEVDIFQDLASDEVEAMGLRAPMREVAAGTQFYSPNLAVEVLFILKVGRVRLYHLSADGKALTTAVLEAGTIFGEMAMLGQELPDSYAEALDPCVLCLMSRDDVRTLLLGDPRIAFRITEILGRRLVETERQLSDFAFKRVPARVASLLVRRAAPRRSWLGRPGPPQIRCTHEELAEMVGASRETVTKVLNELRGQGMIELRRGIIHVIDPAALRVLADG